MSTRSLRKESSLEKRHSTPWATTYSTTSVAVLMIISMLLPCENSRRKLDVPMTMSSPWTPVSRAFLTSSMWQRTWVRILAFLRPSLQMVLQSSYDC